MPRVLRVLRRFALVPAVRLTLGLAIKVAGVPCGNGVDDTLSCTMIACRRFAPTETSVKDPCTSHEDTNVGTEEGL